MKHFIYLVLFISSHAMAIIGGIDLKKGDPLSLSIVGLQMKDVDDPIESAFATVKLRTRDTKGAGNSEAATVMAFKLLMECQKRWKKTTRLWGIKKFAKRICL